MVEIIRFAEKISGKKLKIEFVNRNHILVELQSS